MFQVAIGIIIILGLIVLVLLIINLNKRMQAPAIDPQVLMLLQQRIENLNVDMKGSLSENVRLQQTASHQMTSAVRDVTERLVKI